MEHRLEVGKSYLDRVGRLHTVHKHLCEEDEHIFYTDTGVWYNEFGFYIDAATPCHNDMIAETESTTTKILKSNLELALHLAIGISSPGTAFVAGLQQVLEDLRNGKSLIVE